MNSVVNLKDGFITFNSNIDYSLSFSKCAIGYSNYNVNSHERGSLVFLTNNNANTANISMNTDIRMCIASDGNIGIGTNNPMSKLEVNGNINITAGSKYKINNYNLAFSNIDGPLPAAGVGTGGTLGGVKVDGSTITITNNVISATAQVNSDWNETSTASKAFILNKPTLFDGNYNSLSNKPTLFDGNYNSLTNKLTAGTNINIIGNVINNTYSLPVATTDISGGVTLDGTSIVNVNGKITAVQVQADWNVTNTLSRAYILNKPIIPNNSQWTYSGTQIYYNGGNVGIGTSSTNALLHLHKTGTTADVRIQITDGASTAGADRGVHLIKSGNTGYLFNYEDGPLLLGTNGTERMTISNTGNVGIGINNPIGRLHLHRENATFSQSVNLHFTDTLTGTTATDGFVIGKGDDNIAYLYNNENTDMVFGINGGERMRIYTDNSIRTPYGGAFISQACIARGNGFDIRMACFSTGMFIEMGDAETFRPHYFRFGAYGATSYIESGYSRNIVFRVYSSYIPTGTFKQWAFNEGGPSYNGLGSAYWTIPSDQRIKENIVKADLNKCYDNVKNINLYRYNYIDAYEAGSNDKNKLGYIAQEVKRHFPKATYRKKERLSDKREIPDLLSIDVEQINLTLYGAVKQLIKIVEKQNKRIKTLETLLNIDDNDDVENDAGEAYERIYDEEEVDIDTIEPTEPEQDKAPETTNVSNKV